jgi:tetratricopeptide (TPR) repeat protein
VTLRSLVSRTFLASACSFLLPTLLLSVIAGCKPKASKGPVRGPSVRTEMRDALFDSVADNLNRLEEFDMNQMMPQICDRLNQWYRQEKPQVAWQQDPLIERLPDELQDMRIMKTLDLIQYRMIDAWYLQESVWLRDISKGARGDAFDDLDVAQRLFDWTIRNVYLEPDRTATGEMNRHRPFEALLLGRGEAIDRAWVFMLLARQQGLDVVLLGFSEDDGKDVKPWLPALVSNGELYLFDCRLGLPVPGPAGQPVAMLSQVVADPDLLRQLDLDAEHPYPVTAEDLQHVVALVEGSPQSLSRRMALVEARLAGDHKIALISPGDELAERVKNLSHVTDARLWQHPFEIWQRQATLGPDELQEAAREVAVFQAVPTLMTARSLYFKGNFDGEDGAKVHFMNARPADSVIDDYRLPEETARKLRREEIPQYEAARIVLLRHAKQDASFWLGLVCYEQADYPVAADYFAKRTIEATPNGPWTQAARYNLARTYEAMGQIDDAITLYESDTSPQRHGNKLRARRLRGETASVSAEPDSAPTSPATEEQSANAAEEPKPAADAPETAPQ